MTRQSDILKLPKAPLQEVIFEVRWELDSDEDSGLFFDSDFNITPGLLMSKVKKDFPIFKSKLPNGIPISNNAFIYQAIYQYWSGENLWPVLQLGPGIFTINETENNYQWDSHYFPLIKKGLSWLESIYENKLNYNFASLRYIDRISTNDYAFSDWVTFISNNLNFDVKLNINTNGALKHFSFNQVFEMKNGSDLQITISNGKNKKNEDILVWETAVNKLCSFNNKNIIKWVEESHQITHNTFKEICKDELYNSFK